jgi:hypothetical protein
MSMRFDRSSCERFNRKFTQLNSVAAVNTCVQLIRQLLTSKLVFLKVTSSAVYNIITLHAREVVCLSHLLKCS